MKQKLIKAISAFLAILMILSAAPIAGITGLYLPAAEISPIAKAEIISDTYGDNLTWSFNTESGLLEFLDGDIGNDMWVTIPAWLRIRTAE